MATARHWLLQTPNDFLAEYNLKHACRQGSGDHRHPTFTQLTARIFVFSNGAIHLIKKRDDWVVHEIPLTTARNTPNKQPAIYHHVLTTLLSQSSTKHLVRDMQFMEFSEDQPLTRSHPMPQSNVPNELIISIILTVGKSWSSIPGNTETRQDTKWVPRANIDEMQHPTYDTTTNRPLARQDVVDAYARLDACSRPSLLLSIGLDTLRSVCLSTLLGIIDAIALADNRGRGYGWIAANDTAVPQAFAFHLFPCSQEESVRIGMVVEEGRPAIRTAGCWGERGIQWKDGGIEWNEFLEAGGRLRVDYSAAMRTMLPAKSGSLLALRILGLVEEISPRLRVYRSIAEISWI